MYNNDLYPYDYCEQAGDLLIKVIEHPKTTQKQKTAILQELGQLAKLSTYRDYDLYDIRIADANKSFHSTGRKSVGID